MKNTSWGSVADWYDESLEKDNNTYQSKVILPNLIRIVAPEKGKTIIDVACGQGFFSRAFAEKGAKVVGSDVSSELIELAEKQSSKEIKYFVSSADSFIANGEKSLGKDLTNTADVVTIVLALQNIENLTGTISECSKALKVGGRLVFVLNHPAFRIPGASSWEWKDDGLIRAIDSYMSDDSVKINMTPSEKDPSKKKFTVSFHRPLQSYVKALAKSGLAVTKLEEWISHKKSQEGPKAAEEDRMRKEIPVFVCIEAIKMA